MHMFSASMCPEIAPFSFQILGAHSHVLEKMFFGKYQEETENEIDLMDVDAEVFSLSKLSFFHSYRLFISGFKKSSRYDVPYDVRTYKLEISFIIAYDY